MKTTEKQRYFALFLVTLTWFSSISWVWSKIGVVGVVLGLPLSVLITLPMVGILLWLGRPLPQKKPLLLAAFLWGASLAAFFSIWSQEGLQALIDLLWGERFSHWFRPLVITPVTEEVFKGLFLLWMATYQRAQIKQLLSGIVYGGLIGAGFAFTEQIMYFGNVMVVYLNNHASDSSALLTLVMSFILRGLMVPFMHSFFVTFIALGVVLSRRTYHPFGRYMIILAGFLFPIILHGVWDWAGLASHDRFLIFKIYVLVMVPLFLALSFYALILRRRQRFPAALKEK